MTKNLLIVESPAKAKTIEKFLGKDFKVKSSYGHIRDLAKNDMGVDIENGFEPRYIISPDKKKVVKDLKSSVRKVDEVWLATDEDREGEAISWHLCEVLGLNIEDTKRIVFREITRPAIKKAIKAPRKLDVNLVNAQQARRVLDRLVGFELSEILWRKVKGKLSAGRVQSVAVKLIVDREREIQNFKPQQYYRIAAIFEVESPDAARQFEATLPKRFSTEEEAMRFLQACADSTFTVESIEVRPLKRKPAAPFTTSTLQQEASRKLSYHVKRTMRAAQRLYEQGLITYMRTDSTSLSDVAMTNIAKTIESNYGEEYLQVRKYATKKALAQEAHEAIRPTYIEREVVSQDRELQRLYDLIRKRTIASQMADARFEKTSVNIAISRWPDDTLQAVGEVLKFDGFLKVYMESKDDEEEDEIKGLLPKLHKGQQLDLEKMEARERFTRPPARYTEASLVKKLEELGIGRPSTYAPTISKIMEEGRGYVTRESRPGHERKFATITLADGEITRNMHTEITGSTSNRLYASDLGIVVTDFLNEHFGNVMNYSFTARIEEQFDTIAEGKLPWNAMLSDFYTPFHDTVEKTMENASRARGKRILGTDEKTGHTVLAQMTRYGPVVQIGTREEVGEEGKPKFANLRPGQSLETIELDEAMKLFELPRTLGTFEDKEVIVNTGRYGPYVKYNDQYISLPRGSDPLETTLDEARELILQKRRENEPIGEYKGKPITKGKGRYGPYLKWNGLYVNIPKRMDMHAITLEEAHDLISKKEEKEANRYIKRWEKEKINIENGRWGPFIRKGRKSISIPKINGRKVTSDQARLFSLEEVREIIAGKVPKSLEKKLEESSDAASE